MNTAMLPVYPVRNLLASLPGGQRHKSVNCRWGLTLDLLLLVVVAAILYESRELKRRIERPWLDTDLHHVFELIPSRNEYKQLHAWCGLAESRATQAERAMIRAKLRSSQSLEQFLVSPIARHLNWNRITGENFGTFRWIRLSDPKDLSRWIGIGVIQIRDDAWIVCCVPIGF